MDKPQTPPVAPEQEPVEPVDNPSDGVTDIKPATDNRMKMLYGLAVIMFLVIVGLLIYIFSLQRAMPSSDNSTLNPVIGTTVPVTSATPAVSTAAGAWKDLTENYVHTASNSRYTITGRVPADTTVTEMTGDTAGIILRNKNYTFTLSFPHDGATVHYASYKDLGYHPQFGTVYRVRFEDNTNKASYITGPVSAQTACQYLTNTVAAPCGKELLVHEGPDAILLVNARCEAAYEYRDSICDPVMSSVRIEQL